VDECEERAAQHDGAEVADAAAEALEEEPSEEHLLARRLDDVIDQGCPHEGGLDARVRSPPGPAPTIGAVGTRRISVVGDDLVGALSPT
jgi:hypothetical protein